MSYRGGGKKVFGQAMEGKRGGGGGSRYQRQMGQGGGRQAGSSQASEEELMAQRRAERKRRKQVEGEELDARFGYERFDHRNRTAGGGNDTKGAESRRGWIFNMLPTTVMMAGDDEGPASASEGAPNASSAGPERSGVDLYFRTASGDTFKSTVLYDPYFYLVPDLTSLSSFGRTSSSEQEESVHAVFFEHLISTLMRTYDSLSKVELVHKTDLDQVNHLSRPKGRPMLKLIFDNVQQLMDVRKSVKDLVQSNQKRAQESENSAMISYDPNRSEVESSMVDPMSTLMDIREYDVPYLVRVCIDLEIRAGAWYTVTPNPGGGVSLTDQDVETKANPTYMAFDIECTKAPLKFPDANVDTIYMISYMVDGQGYLILSRDVVGQDVMDFEYTPKPSYPGPFHIFNELTEEDLIRRFFSEYQRLRPQIVVTYNGDFFDWPFLEQRAAMYGLDIGKELGVERVGGNGKENSGGGEYRGRCCVHLDAFHWVQRDSYLPQGSQGLKAVTKYKLGYDPVEVDPEDMLTYAKERPVHMASYSVSDAVATYYLYEKYVHMFIFSLATIIPMGPEDVLRKGSGTLCEALLMVQACTKDIICPNKQLDPLARFHDGHLLESETYIGGKVECLETGVYRSDIEYKFELKPTAFQGLIDNVDRDLTFAIEVEGGLDRSKIVNYDEIRCQIVEQLEMLRDRPNRTEKPYIYHLDVGAMYPNIILTNRLQPSAIVDDATCAACDFNQEKNGCKRPMDWVWRGDFNPANKSEYDRTKDQLSRETTKDGLAFHQLPDQEQEGLISSRLKIYARNAYKKSKVTEEVNRKDTVCMRENDFYVETVRRFRDRRYELKKLTKVTKNKISKAKDPMERKEAEDKTLVYDSLQVAHKCILNSFYGYVMRKGARWRSMEMAGIVTKNGADLITQARILVEQIGRPLELDTDGIWCILPISFPDNFIFKTETGGTFKLEYPCVMLNADVHDKFTNHQYQSLVDKDKGIYETRSENSIFFEVDGPYRCMVLPSSTEEGKLLKKRYAVFNFDGSLAELKGFELKRRGELELIKTFQSQVFERFLDGNSLVDCYDSVAEIANHWIDVLDTQGESLETDELVDLISENRSMSRQLEDYGDQKGTSQTTARRLGEFLGAEVIKDKGLNCKFIIAERPFGAPVTERAIPTAIWKAEPAVMKHFLRKWLKSPGMDVDDFDIRNVLDWDYYMTRLGKTIQKIITIPAALQKVPNPVPRIPHPEWLQNTVRRLNDRYQQKSITSMFKTLDKDDSTKEQASKASSPKAVKDIEDMFGTGVGSSKGIGRPIVHTRKRRGRLLQEENDADEISVDESPGETTNSENVNEIIERVPLSKDNFQNWLSKRKKSWRTSRKENRKRTDTAAIPGPGTSKRKKIGGMEGYIRDAALALTQHEWQVIEVRDISSFEATSSNGEFLAWVMVGASSLQKVQISVPRTIYLSCRAEIRVSQMKAIEVKRVEKHLPHNKTGAFVYEVTMPEEMYRNGKWTQELRLASGDSSEKLVESIIDGAYEMNTPLLLRAAVALGSVSRVGSSSLSNSTKNSKSFALSQLARVEKPTEGEYLRKDLSYRRIFLYENLSRNKTGLIALFILEGGSGERDAHGNPLDLTRPSEAKPGTFELNASCHFWIVKPGGEKGQKNVTIKHCEGIFSQLLAQIHNASPDDDAGGKSSSEYECVSPSTNLKVPSLNFVNDEQTAFSSVNEVLTSYSQANHGPTLLLVNNTKPMPHLRRAIPISTAFPLVTLSFPPGPAYNSSKSVLPALNWEPMATQLCMEAYMYMCVVSYPKRVSYARYGNVPIGNLGKDENLALYDVSFSRHLQKSRAISWASEVPSSPDLGCSALSFIDGSGAVNVGPSSNNILDNNNEVWGDDDALISPVIRRPGAYRSVCVEIDLHNLAIAALTDPLFTSTASGPSHQQNNAGGSDADNGVVFGSKNEGTMNAGGAPLGDELSTAVSLPLLRALVHSWLRDAYGSNSQVADDLLHDIYRLICSPESLLNDPALHRVIHTMMKSTFLRLVGEMQRLGCSIVCASFNRIVVATNKMDLYDAKEYIEFVIQTIRKRSSATGGQSLSEDGIGRIVLHPNNYYTHYLFLDEHNFGGIHFEQREPEEDELEWAIMPDKTSIEDGDNALPVIPTVVNGWNIMHYLASDIAQEYFRAIIGRFSKDIFRKQKQLEVKSPSNDMTLAEISAKSKQSMSVPEQLLNYKKKLLSKHFSTYLTRAVGEIGKDGGGSESFPKLPGSHLDLFNPQLEFVKNVLVILQLDPDVEHEVHILKKSLLAQIGVQEYSSATQWQNPCADFILPAVFCMECHESRDVNLCVLPPPDEDETIKKQWECEDCGTPFDSEQVERRLIDIVQQKNKSYQLQDLRCSKTEQVATRAILKQSDCSAELKLDIPRNKYLSEMRILRNLAIYFELDWLLETIDSMI